ncbi:MAG: L,D-transpeptidase [Gammaproteobacteria bacterium]|nr:L,D-transpeptidase [Gammaproteobacteria bacterium]
MKSVFFGIIAAVCLGLTGCVEYDPSTYVIDDYGVSHHSVYYTKDKRGRDYFPEKIKPTGHRLFVFDPKAYAWAAYDAYGHRRMTGGASGGADYCDDIKGPCRTVTGIFRMYNKRGISCFSKEFPRETSGGTKMPYCMYFHQGYAIHAGFEVPYANKSHGCIRVFPSAAKWLNEEFMQHGTQVLVLSYTDENGNDKTEPGGA